MKKETAEKIWRAKETSEITEIVEDLAGEIIKHRAGHDSAADVVAVGGQRYILSPRISNNDYQHQNAWSIDYAVADKTGKVLWVFIGHKLLGPCYQRGTDGKWRNCYSHANFGKNFASGGTWSGGREAGYINGKSNADANNGIEYSTLAACIDGRADEIARARARGNAVFLRFAAVPAQPPVLMPETHKLPARDANGRFKSSK